MDGAATDCTAFAEAVVFLSYFKGLLDPRQLGRQLGKVTCPLDEVLLLCLLAVLAGAECFTEIALFGTKRSSRCPARSRMARRRMITWVISSRPWTPISAVGGVHPITQTRYPPSPPPPHQTLPLRRHLGRRATGAARAAAVRLSP